ncbi:MMPL family transporter [Microbacterium sp. ASV49]|uniref:Efflux RND transporter permease subunit n=1 Tax=Microbacterium candidum TaxID=3041922 RepID=A0ABT7N495_9MICO|nr:efflux RND transporter permease subunit [Microbacterium sp. ASV49]MDL9981519.1 efflux RND transporter permease subunit [Microbacterium sp. ASV49]
MRARRLLPGLLSAVIILAWLIAAGLGGPLFGRVDEVSSNEQTSYLPTSADATEVQKRLGDFLGSDSLPAVVVFRSAGTIDDTARSALQDAVTAVADMPGIASAPSPVLVSDDKRAAEAFIPISASAEIGAVVHAVDAKLRAHAPSGVDVFITGPAGFTADLVGAFAGIDGLLLGAALLAVFIILVIVYRSLLLPVVVLFTSMFALCVALLVVWWLAKDGVLLLSGQTQGILFILVIGAATDYSLLMVARFREELRSTKDRGVAIRRAWRGAFEPILASGGTVIAGLLCLLLSDLKSNSTLGPVAAIGIVFAMLSALTLLPALLFAFGRAVFWPRRPVYDPAASHDDVLTRRGPWPRVARVISSRPRLTWIAATIVLLAAAAGVLQLQADGVAQSDLVLGQSDARDGQAVLGEHFPAGSGSPVYVVVDETRLQDAADVLLADAGVGSVSVVAAGSPSGTASVTANGLMAVGPRGTPAPAPTVADGDVLLQATLTHPADSTAAADTVTRLRGDLDPLGAKVGGVTATAVDTNAASIHDRTLIIPVVLAVILVILMLLLRAIVAPLLLVATTVLSFASALGISALVFDHVFRFPGADPAVPLYAFVFLVALGVDYNIFLMTRVREESLRHGTREGILRGLVITGGVITSAGIVLAATFAALSVIPILFLVQIAFIVALGVLLDTFIVRSLLVPALSYDIGRAIWWPSRLARRSLAPVERQDVEPTPSADASVGVER